MRRREFITLLGGAAAWPLVARAQQGEKVRRIGVLLPQAADDQEAQTRVGAFQQELQQLGWTIGRNLRIEQAVCVTLRAIAVELFSPLHQVALAPVFFDQLGDAVAALTVALGALMSPKMR
jgi:hypothetical protein